MKRKVLKKEMIKNIITYTLCFTIGATFLDALIDSFLYLSYKKTFSKNKEIYRIELNEYNENLKRYADSIKKLNLSDLEIIMKVMNDTWNSIDGYGTPDNLIPGLARLSFQEEKKGICTSFADDFTAKMNAINPEYDAHNIVVYAQLENDNSNTKCTVNIDKNIMIDEIVTTEKRNYKKEKNNGNHMVSTVRIKDKNLTLVVDPTNLLIGVLKNGKIYIFNTDKMKMNYISDSTRNISDSNVFELYKAYYSTYFDEYISLDSLKNVYGLNTQKKALKKVLDTK